MGGKSLNNYYPILKFKLYLYHNCNKLTVSDIKNNYKSRRISLNYILENGTTVK